MDEQELNKIVGDIIEPLKETHLKFLDVILQTAQEAFYKGIEVGQKLNK